jgi:FPC/CPF motif-containing protein YcgG
VIKILNLARANTPFTQILITAHVKNTIPRSEQIKCKEKTPQMEYKFQSGARIIFARSGIQTEKSI